MRHKLTRLLGSTVVAVGMASIVLTAMAEAALAGPAVEKATGSIVMGTGVTTRSRRSTSTVFEQDDQQGLGDVHELRVPRSGSGVWVQTTPRSASRLSPAASAVYTHP